MNEDRTIRRISPHFKLERNTVIYSRWLGGESANKLANSYQMDKEVVRRIIKNYDSKVKAGILPSVAPYED